MGAAKRVLRVSDIQEFCALMIENAGGHDKDRNHLGVQEPAPDVRGRSVLVIDHDMKFVEDIAHKVTVLHQGQILSEGSMEHVKNDPKVIEVYLGH
jgi:ABC-type uncharacterized transport system ATPase subunit